LDASAEDSIYKTLLAQVKEAQGAIVSIAHKPDVAAFHRSQWVLAKSPAGDLASYQLRADPAPR